MRSAPRQQLSSSAACAFRQHFSDMRHAPSGITSATCDMRLPAALQRHATRASAATQRRACASAAASAICVSFGRNSAMTMFQQQLCDCGMRLSAALQLHSTCTFLCIRCSSFLLSSLFFSVLDLSFSCLAPLFLFSISLAPSTENFCLLLFYSVI